jgi:TRAP-type C4-dicarboxylate transport system permease large subunit
MIMAGMSGSGIADAAGSGAVLIPAMQRARYSVPFAAAIVAAAGTIGPIIPPSIPFVIYGSLANTSIGRLLLAGAMYAFVLGFFVYGELRLRDLPKILTESVMGTAAVAIIISAAQPMSWILTYEGAPMKVLAIFQDAQLSPAMLLLIFNVILLILGCFMEGLAVMVMAVPVLMPLIQAAGIDPVHFGVVFVLNAMIGTITPPVGTIMYVVCALSKISIGQFSREAWPLIVTLILCLGIVTYVPILSTWLPDLVMPLR